MDLAVKALTEFNDGGGPALYVGGNFTNAGGVPALFIAKWNGSSWLPMNGGVLGTVNALTVFDDGSGPALFAGGAFGVAKWNGASWSFLSGGMNGPILALAVFDDGLGPRLYAGGSFSTAGGVAMKGIAKWTGLTWAGLGTGQPPGIGGVTYALVNALVVFDDGSGDALYVGGNFTSAGTIPNFNHIAKWDGSNWLALGSGMNDHVNSLTVFNDASGPALYAGGAFTIAGGVSAHRIAKWNGAGWSTLPSGPNGDIHVLMEFNDGSGRALYAGGQFTSAGGVTASNLAKWNGSSWSAVGSATSGQSYTDVSVLTSFNDGSGRALYVGGNFRSVSGLGANSIAKWNGTLWSTVGHGIHDAVLALTLFNDGSGPALYAGGRFLSTPGAPASHIAVWNGSKWFSLGTGMDNSVSALGAFDDGSGSALYAVGEFTSAGGITASHIAKWNNSTWSALGSGFTGPGYPSAVAMTAFDDGGGPALYAGGLFSSAGGGAANNIAKWDGGTWVALGSGTNGTVLALVGFDDGTGPALYVGGQFTSAGGVAASNIARWDGASWLGLSNAMNGYYTPMIASLAVFDDGNGPALYASGYFTSIGGIAANSIAKWSGSSWTSLGTGLEGPPANPPITQPYRASSNALAVFDDGGGQALYAAGDFTIAGGSAARSIAKWNGSSWSALGGGLDGFGSYVSSLAIFDDSSGLALYAGGGFSSAVDSRDSHLAKWGCPFLSSGTIYCTTGTTSNGCVPALVGAGSASATAGSGFTISLSNLESHRLGVVFYGIHGQLALPWGAGGTSLLCVKAPTQRLDPYDSGGSPGLCNGLITEDWNLFIATHGSALGQPFLGGESVWAQGWFRDPPSSKTTGLSNGLVFAVAP